MLFTADPLTGNPWRFVLEASFGLARDWVASTGATPVDRFLFEWDSGEILGREIAREYRVPVVRAFPSDLERLVEGSWVEVDGTRGVLTLGDA